MDELSEKTLMGLPEFCALFHHSPSSERRLRREQQDWPPHVEIGRRVFYLRDGVRAWLVRRGVAQGAGSESGLSADGVD